MTSLLVRESYSRTNFFLSKVQTGKQRHKNIWHLTEAGKRWGTVIADKARTHDKIIEHVRWLPDILNVIDLS
jgi:hypothetical protein